MFDDDGDRVDHVPKALGAVFGLDQGVVGDNFDVAAVQRKYVRPHAVDAGGHPDFHKVVQFKRGTANAQQAFVQAQTIEIVGHKSALTN